MPFLSIMSMWKWELFPQQLGSCSLTLILKLPWQFFFFFGFSVTLYIYLNFLEICNLSSTVLLVSDSFYPFSSNCSAGFLMRRVWHPWCSRVSSGGEGAGLGVKAREERGWRGSSLDWTLWIWGPVFASSFKGLFLTPQSVSAFPKWLTILETPVVQNTVGITCGKVPWITVYTVQWHGCA